MTQLLTEHGSFGTFLRRIGKVETAICPFCTLEDDSVTHTIQVCPEWAEQRIDLQTVVSLSLELTDIIGAISSSRDAWLAFSRFAECDMRAKEEAERVRGG